MKLRLPTMVFAASVAVLALLSCGTPANADPLGRICNTSYKTITYDVTNAPRWAAVIRQAAELWNSELCNVKFQELDSTDAYLGIFEEPSGMSHVNALRGYLMWLSDDQIRVNPWSATRVAKHEMGHILGLPDNYNGDCSLLMSGGSAGPWCTSTNATSWEINTIDGLWQ